MTRALLPTCLRASAPVDMRATHPLALRLRRYGVAVVATGSALLFHYGLDAIMDQRALFLKVALAVLVSAWYGGLGPGLFATGLGALAALFMFFPPYYRLALPLQEDGIALAVLVCAGGVISLLVAQLRQARQRAEQFALLGHLAASVSHDIRNPLVRLCCMSTCWRMLARSPARPAGQIWPQPSPRSGRRSPTSMTWYRIICR